MQINTPKPWKPLQAKGKVARDTHECDDKR